MDYSAGMVSCLFWLNEIRNTIPFYKEGKTVAEMRQISVEQNLYQVRAEDRCKRIAGVAYKRLEALTPELIDELYSGESTVAKLILLVSIMKTDLLFAEFMQQVYKHDLITGSSVLSDSDIKEFFDNKIRTSETVARFSESAIAKLKQTYVKMLINAGLIESAQNKVIQPVLIDYRLQDMFKRAELGAYISTLTGTDI